MGDADEVGIEEGASLRAVAEARTDGDGGGLRRRQFLARGAAAGGAFAWLWSMPPLVRDAYGQPISVPEEARSVEAGLSLFTARWQVAGPVIRLTRFGQFISDKVFNCRVSDQPRSYVLRVGSAGATLSPGIDPFRHADMVMPEADWLGILYGDFTGFAPLLAGECFPSRDAANKVVLLATVMYVFAHLPPGEDTDPELLVRILEGIIARGGLPECEGEPEALEELHRLQHEPLPELEHTVLPPASAVPATRTLAEFVAGLGYDDLPPGAVASAKEQLTSILGAMYGGSRMAPARKFARAVRGFGDRAEATVIGRKPFRTSARHAALLNSVYAQLLEWEDWTFIAHSGSAIVPTALAAGELGRASGAELIAAIVAGNEILARSGPVLTDVLHTGQAVPTHQLETPLVAGKLLGLGPARLQDALGICCTQPQVTSISSWTADAKGLVAGWPVMQGVEAAQYAKAGISGRRDIVENPDGYCYRVSDIASPVVLEQLVEGLGETWRFDAERNELFTKRYPTDGFQLTAVQAVLDIVNGQAADVFGRTPRERLPELVTSIQLRAPLLMSASASMFSKDTKEIYERIRSQPDWTYTALLFDGKYPLAAALANRRLTFREYEDRTIFDPVVQALIDRIDLRPDISMGVFGAEVRVELADGRSFTSTQECIGDFPVAEKLRIGAGGILSRRKIRRIVRAIDRLESFDDVRDFVRVVTGGR
jgi:2-methylcitrate dehydratase PrpD